MRFIIFCAACLLTAVPGHGIAGTNAIDRRFGAGGVVTLPATPNSGLVIATVFAIAPLDDGKIIIGGRAYDNDPDHSGALVAAVGRLNTDGSWDTTFADNGLFVLPYGAASAPYGGAVHNLAVLSDGRILAVGGSTTASLSQFRSCALLIELTANGTPVSGFGSSGSSCFDFAPDSGFGRSGHFESLQVDSDDSFFLSMPSTNLYSGAVAHFDASGALMTSFGDNGVATLPTGIYCWILKLLPDGKLLATGIDTLQSDQQIAVTRLEATGSIDTGYGTDGLYEFDQYVGSIVNPQSTDLDAQGRLLIGDNDIGGSGRAYSFARVTSSGAADAAFNGGDQQPGAVGFARPVVSGTIYDYLVAAIPLTDGHIFAVGNAGYIDSGDGPVNLALLRLNEDSGYDAGFGAVAHPGWVSLNFGGTSASVTYARAAAMTAARDRILISATISQDTNGNNCVAIVRAVPDRLFDDAFDPPPVWPACPQ